jgi:hypothetical protein
MISISLPVCSLRIHIDLQGFHNCLPDLIDPDRLIQTTKDAQLVALAPQSATAVRSDPYHHRIEVQIADVLDELYTIDAGHPHIGDNQIEWFGRDQLQGFCSTLDRYNRVSILHPFQCGAQDEKHSWIIIDDQNPCIFVHAILSRVLAAQTAPGQPEV